jgi:hypothetical protein
MMKGMDCQSLVVLAVPVNGVREEEERKKKGALEAT